MILGAIMSHIKACQAEGQEARTAEKAEGHFTLIEQKKQC